MTDRHTFTIPEGHEAVRDADGRATGETRPALPAPEGVPTLDNTQIEHMVRRFLGWRLPEDFSPDAGVSFEPDYNQGTPWPMKHEPVGTNLFDAQQATAMVRHMVEGLPAAPAPEGVEPVAWVVRLHYDGGARLSGEMLTDHLPSNQGTYDVVRPLYAAETLAALQGRLAAMERERDEAQSECRAYREAYGCLSCGEEHPRSSPCPPFEVRTTGAAWFNGKHRKAVARAITAEASLAKAVKALEKASAKFREYAEHHLAKGTTEGTRKSLTNSGLAIELDAVITSITGGDNG